MTKVTNVDHIKSFDDTWQFVSTTSLPELMQQACVKRDAYWHNIISYSPKVFLPLTHLCRDVCHYCTFAKQPKQLNNLYMSEQEVLAQIQQAQKLGCKEALITLGEKPELKYKEAKHWLEQRGFISSVEYVAHIAKFICENSNLLPHVNAGCLTRDEYQLLKPFSPSMGLMLESSSERLCEKGQVHYGSPDKAPQKRLQSIADAGKEKIPFTTGILIGIGESREERVQSILDIRQLHEQYGHIQEVIIQNFSPKADTKMAEHAQPSQEDLQWTIAMARLLLPVEISVQTPPNLNSQHLPEMIDAGINDWGGVSPLTPDFVNPESAWPVQQRLLKVSAQRNKFLQERLTVYPTYIDAKKTREQYLHGRMQKHVLTLMDAQGWAKTDTWKSGESVTLPKECKEYFEQGLQQLNNQLLPSVDISPELKRIFAKVDEQKLLTQQDIVFLLNTRGYETLAVCQRADHLRKQLAGEQVTFVKNRNINYTNICIYSCQFCAFSKGSKQAQGKEAAYQLDVESVVKLAQEAWNDGATEVCLQGGIHPSYTGQTYLDICQAIRTALPDMHIHAFSPLEISQGATTLGISVREFLTRLKAAGLNSLPGTAAEILHDDVRDIICADKLNTQQWLDVMRTAHELGIKTTATIMFGHVESSEHIAEHLLAVRNLQRETQGFTEFVPLPFVAKQAPMAMRGQSRQGPSLREALLIHAVSRLALSPWIKNIQASWVKLGDEGVQFALRSGANDIGGTLMNESITRAAGAQHGQCKTEQDMQAWMRNIQRPLALRNTFYTNIVQ